MDRQIVQVGAIPQDTDLLNTNKNTMIALGMAMQAILGTSTRVDGLACTPTVPAGMTVNVAPGSIYSYQNVDGTAYVSIAADTAHQIVKQGISLGTTNLSCPAPGTVGQSVVYLVQAAYQDTDGGATVLPYYNASNPAVAYNGPNNTGTSNFTVRQGQCLVQVKAGVAATTGTQATPSPDAGFTGLFAITVANGATTITSGNIVQLTTAPFITPKLPDFIPTVQTGGYNYAVDTSVTANTITVALSPVPASIPDGFPLRVKVANTTTGASVINLNASGNVATSDNSGNALGPNSLKANSVYDFIKNGSRWELHSVPATISTREVLTANRTYYVRPDGSDSNTGLANTSGGAFLTIQKAINIVANTLDLGGQTVTIQVAAGTYAGAVVVNGPFTGQGTVLLQGDTTTPANCVISTTSANAIAVNNRGTLSVAGLKLMTTTSGAGLTAQIGGQIAITGNMNFGACANSHLAAVDGGIINIGASYTVSGGATSHFSADRCSVIDINAGLTITLSGTPAFSTAFAFSTSASSIYLVSVTFTGSGTGVRYSAAVNGTIFTNGAGATYLPGNSAGSVATGGQYV